MSTTTPNFDFTLPAIGGAVDADLWGGQLNGNWTELDGILVATTANNTLSGNNTFSGDSTFTGQILTPDAGLLTIASGVITVTGNYHTIDTEGGGASDDLNTIDTGAEGKRITLRIEDDARDVVIKNATGNILTPDGNDITLDTTDEVISLIFDSTLSNWLVTAQGKRAVTIDATATAKGVVEVATQAEIETETELGGTGATLIIGPDKIKDSPGATKAFINFNGTGVVAIRGSYNVTSITDNGTGNYTVNITNAFADTNGSVTYGGRRSSTIGMQQVATYFATTSTITVETDNSSGAATDYDIVNITATGDFA